MTADRPLDHAALSPDGTLVATASGIDLQIWRVGAERGELVRTIAGAHTGTCAGYKSLCVCFVRSRPLFSGRIVHLVS